MIVPVHIDDHCKPKILGTVAFVQLSIFMFYLIRNNLKTVL